MKLSEDTKVTLTLRQIKRLIRESEIVEYVNIPLGLTADKNAALAVKGDIEGDPSPWSIVDDLYGQLSDGKWENSRAMEKWWMPVRIVDNGKGELCLRVQKGPIKLGWNGRYVDTAENPYVDFEGRFDAMKIREWIANHLKVLVKDELSPSEWRRDNEEKLDYFDAGTTVAMVYAVYDILKNRPPRGDKNIWFSAFKA